MTRRPGPNVVTVEALRSWVSGSERLASYASSLAPGAPTAPPSGASGGAGAISEPLGLPLHLEFAIRGLVAADPGAPAAAIASISFFSLCKGLFLPLSGLAPDRAAALFGFRPEPPPDASGREALVRRFLEREVGLGVMDKLACLLGDPFRGRAAGIGRDSLLSILRSVRLESGRRLLDRAALAGDVGTLFAEARPTPRQDPPLTAAEVLAALRFLPDEGVGRNLRLSVLRSLLLRCGKLEAWFLARLVLRRAGFGFAYEGALLARALGERFGVDPDEIAHAIALTDAFHVGDTLSRHGPVGLRRIRMQPLVALRPALAGGTTDDLRRYPVWVERKYDGIRFMLHKSTDARGSVLCGGYTRNRHDWLELVPGLDASIRRIPARDAIVDGELYGTVRDRGGVRPATAFEVMAVLHGERPHRLVALKYAAFDLVYLDGHDLTARPLSERRHALQALLAPIQALPLPVPLKLAEGQLAADARDLNRLYAHFRAQGHEGVVAKDPEGPYRFATRDPSWRKRKPEVTLDLVILGAVCAIGDKRTVGTFGSYVVGARAADGGFVEVGDVAGLDRARADWIEGEIVREALATGQRFERRGATGSRPGFAIRPHLVVTVRFAGILRDPDSGALRLREPTLVAVRSDKSAHEADTLADLDALSRRSRIV